MPIEQTAVSRPRAPDTVPGYRLLKLLGKGGMGEVHSAEQLSLGRTVAVKLLRDDLARDENFVARFEKESAALAALRHPNIVTLLDKGRTELTCYIVMELVEGPSLREVMRSPEWEHLKALRLFEQVARGIEYAHGKGVIHRDLKPENILIDEPSGGTPKVTDFGLAGFDEKAGVQLRLTQTHMAMGTASYMAPEQQVDARRADHRADIYSMGVLLYELVTGEVPRGTFAPPSVRTPGVDKRLDPVIARCLKPDPADRYASVGELLKELEPVLPVAASMVGPVRLTKLEKVKLAARRFAKKVGRTAEVAAVAAALVVLGVAALRDTTQASRQPAGLELTADSERRTPITTVGRNDAETHRLTLGEGPDAVPLVVHGRPSRLEQSTVVYPAPEDGQSVGRTVIDADVPGDGLRITTTTLTQPPPRRSLEGLRTFFRGARAPARSALMLMGESGRYVALVVSADGAPPRLEWALGSEKRGEMVAPLPSAAHQPLGLEVNPETGAVSAWLGTGKDRRRLGEELALGPDWRRHFGEPPRAAVGCLEGACRFEALVVEGLMKAPAAPQVEVAPTPVVVRPVASRVEPKPQPVRNQPVRKTTPSHKPKKK